ncbi:restriction endonuclease subunit S [Arcticibacterium luteifluviistationis]|uniref:Restriction endonuclease subunit S n=1 Tax=Arcticibacterium luteifluviistationis TaxID=1784714 RepID=A0A2Z4GBH0_9BACT|nr:restriction endonuclease subunit S [Arcticibacterium luteifluviistationis]AWV98484.1 restriction endonuclease subunit S [Arcticibacterium luteifluviistationis]
MLEVKSKRLGDIINFKRGYDLPASKRENGQFPIISSSGISGYHNEFKCSGEGLVTGRYGTLGEMYYINGNYWPHNTTLYATDFKGNFPKYLYYLLKSLGNLKTSDKSAVPGINRNDLHEIKIPFLPKEYQIQIAKVLSDLDAKIELNNKINAELEAMAKLIYDYWFVQFDFPIDKATAEKMGNPSLERKPYKTSGGKMVYNKELKREIPEGWEVVALKKVLDCNKNTLKKNNGYKVLRYLDTSNLTKNVINELKELVPNVDKIPSRAQRIVGENDILYSTVRPNQCHYGLIKQPVSNLIASTGYAQLSSKDKLITNDLIYSFLTTKWVTEQLQRIANLAVTSYPSISPNDILALRIVLPKDREKLSHINQTLTSFNKKISGNNVENQKLSELRDWLLPMLMNGQVRVGEEN